MRFENAYLGVKKIFTSEMLALIGAVCGMVSLLFAYVIKDKVNAETVDNATAAGGTGFLVFGAAAGILLFIGYIMMILGVNKAKADEDAFKTAFIAIFVALIAGVVASFISQKTINGILTIVSDVAELMITIYIIEGIRNLARKLERKDMDEKGNNLFKMIIAMYALVIIARIILAIFGSKSEVVAAILVVGAGVVEVVQYILYLVYLKKAKEMLA